MVIVKKPFFCRQPDHTVHSVMDNDYLGGLVSRAIRISKTFAFGRLHWIMVRSLQSQPELVKSSRTSSMVVIGCQYQHQHVSQQRLVHPQSKQNLPSYD
jgi:hypothetical protein